MVGGGVCDNVGGVGWGVVVRVGGGFLTGSGVLCWCYGGLGMGCGGMGSDANDTTE